MPKPKNTNLSVFKGREAKLNRAIFQALGTKGPQTIYDMHKQVIILRGLKYTRYASVNKRVKALEELGYIRRIGDRKTKAGFQAHKYELTAKAYLAILFNSISLEKVIAQLDEQSGNEILADILRTFEPRNRYQREPTSGVCGEKHINC